MVQLVGGVTADQFRTMALEDVAVAVRPVGAEGTAEQLPPPDANANQLMFQPAASWLMVNVWVPAGSVTVAVTFTHACQPPGAGTLTEPLRLVPDELEMWNASVTSPTAATRNVTVYVPAVATLTVYLNHWPAAVQPML